MLRCVRLYLVRHAEAAPGEPDELRPLTPAGRETAKSLGKQLAADGVRPSAILTSPLLRARETAAELGRAVGVEPEADERLSPGASPEDIREAVSGRGEVVLVVGHQPDFGQAAAALGGGPEPPFPAGGVAAIDLP
jgi:phosphohistidine phosphatase